MRGKNPIIEFIQGMIYHGFENVGLFYSSYRGVVFDNVDPENLQRLQLIIPAVSGNQAYNYWAFPKGVFYGKGYGMQILPKKGDVVWVEFEGGKPEVPIWTHGHPARKEMPANDEQLKDPACFWFVTPKGHKIKINDTKNTIHIESNLGDVIEINEKGISLVPYKKTISLGLLNKSTFSAVLGEELQTVLNEMQSYMDKHSDALQKDVTASVLAGSPYLLRVNQTTAAPILVLMATDIKAKIKKILSQIVTLE